MNQEEWESFWEYLIKDFAIFETVGTNGYESVGQYLEMKRVDWFVNRDIYDSSKQKIIGEKDG